MPSKTRLIAFILGVTLAGLGATWADWPTHRGNAARTAAWASPTGPRQPKVLWVYRSTEHYLASPVPTPKTLLVSGLGAFNSPILRALALQGEKAGQVVWSKSVPVLKLPVVCPPAFAGHRLIFGDGMHQTDGATLRCLDAETGLLLWQVEFPGRLVHIESAPTVVGQRAYFGAGNGGVVCVDFSRLTLEGKEMPEDAARQFVLQRWQTLLAQYEADRKKNPETAVPPNESQLAVPLARIAWQVGQEKWHVDAPVNVVGQRVLAGSAYLEMEKLGERALFCLDADTGKVLWQKPLRYNPWAGPTVVGEIVLIGGSNIRFDTRLAKKAKGEVAAFRLNDGQPLWQREVPGGVLSAIAAHRGLAIFTATDGRVRALDLATGQLRWNYDAKQPFFAGPAVTDDAVYAADLSGTIHALTLETGQRLWTFSLGQDPAVNAPGLIFGSPVLAHGRLYLATCNHEGPHLRQPTVVVCIGDAQVAPVQ
ncbi:MAG: PQQ-binding-like beta-propeller repeat protein [Gemmatales bacterium]|nr:PQQ-binding-like beta-propeller repeat protein [Gemmatales bacterium]